MRNSFLPIEEAPFIRILLPFLCGILIQYFFPFPYSICIFLFLGILFIIKYHNSSKFPSKRFADRYCFGIAISCFFISTGIATLLIKQKEDLGNFPGKHKYAIASVLNNKETPRTICCEAEIQEWVQHNKKTIRDRLKVILYFKPDSTSRSLTKDDFILFKPDLVSIGNFKNPESFDYASYMKHKGIQYSQYLNSNEWKYLGHKKNNSIKSTALEIQESICKKLQNNNFSETSYAILVALLLGNTDYITPEIRSEFSTSGLSHILAVSGLHTGIIWSLLYVLLSPLVWIKLSRLRPILILVFLWIYAFISGLSPSTVRATIMISFILFGQILDRKGTSLNNLFAAAFFMLLYNPYYLFNISFQLSFIAVFSILYIYPVLYHTIAPSSKWSSYITSIFCVSAAAQIGTLPLVIYYFHELPLFSLLTNLIIVPFLPIILGVGILVLITDYLQISVNFLIEGLDQSLIYIEHLTRAIASLSYSSIRNIWIEPHYLLFLFIVIFTFFWSFRTRRSDILIFTLLFTVLFITADIFYKDQPIRNAWIVYHDNHHTTINFIDNGNNYIFYPNPDKQDSTIEKKAYNFWIKNGIEDLNIVNDNCNVQELYIRLPFIRFKGSTILLLNSEYWKDKKSTYLFPIDYAIISQGFSGKLSDISEIFNIRTIILCADLNYFKQQALQKESDRLGIPYYSIRNSGAWMFDTDTQLRIPSTASN